MDNFYTNELKSDSRIILDDFKTFYQYADDHDPIEDFTSNEYTINNRTQYVHPLEADEAYANAEKFGWTIDNVNAYKNAFWTTGSLFTYYCWFIYDEAVSFSIFNENNSSVGWEQRWLSVNDSNIGARPVFWIQF